VPLGFCLGKERVSRALYAVWSYTEYVPVYFDNSIGIAPLQGGDLFWEFCLIIRVYQILLLVCVTVAGCCNFENRSIVFTAAMIP